MSDYLSKKSYKRLPFNEMGDNFNYNSGAEDFVEFVASEEETESVDNVADSDIELSASSSNPTESDLEQVSEEEDMFAVKIYIDSSDEELEVDNEVEVEAVSVTSEENEVANMEDQITINNETSGVEITSQEQESDETANMNNLTGPAGEQADCVTSADSELINVGEQAAEPDVDDDPILFIRFLFEISEEEIAKKDDKDDKDDDDDDLLDFYFKKQDDNKTTDEIQKDIQENKSGDKNHGGDYPGDNVAQAIPFIRYLFEPREQELSEDDDNFEPEEDDTIIYIRYLFEVKKPAKKVSMVCRDSDESDSDTSDYDETEEGSIRRNTDDVVLSWWFIFLRLSRKIAKCKDPVLEKYLKRKLELLMQQALQVEDENRRNPHHVPFQVPIEGDDDLIMRLNVLRERRLARRRRQRAQLLDGELGENALYRISYNRICLNCNEEAPTLFRRVLLYCDRITIILLILISLCVGYIIVELYDY